ncbi:MAG: dienelactone hydrolase family protein [Dehalococcoidia bacterium]|nr:dienelactone hydrolase family protein [Dehalococcoidia bacterium]
MLQCSNVPLLHPSLPPVYSSGPDSGLLRSARQEDAMPSRWDSVTVDGDAMRCYVAIPAGQGPFPAVVVIQHAGGVDGFIQEMAGRFAAAGYVAIAPDLYHRQDPESGEDPLTRMGRLRDGEIVRDVNAAIDHAGRMSPQATRQGEGEVAAGRIGIAGFCMGGRVSYLMATHVPSLRAAVVFYGGNIMAPWGEGPAPFDRTESIACPLLGLFGEQDTNPSPADVRVRNQHVERDIGIDGRHHRPRSPRADSTSSSGSRPARSFR